MYPHLPHQLAAWLTAAALLGTLSSQSQAAGESISINFGSNEPNGSITASNTAGLQPVPGSNWNQFSEASQSTGQALQDNTGTSTGATVTWSSPNLWKGNGTPTTGDSQMLKGYLDDGGNNGRNSITVSGLDFLTYGVYIYCNADNGTNFSAKTVNGISYTWNGSSTVAGTNAWGAVGTTDQVVQGTNTLYVDGQSASNLTIDSVGIGGGTGNRGGIAGIQIVNTYDGTKISAMLDGETAAWTNTQLGDASWTDSAAGVGTYASINVTNGPSTLTIADGETRRTDAILLSGGNMTVSGGSLNLTGPGILRVAEGSTLTLSSTLSGNAALDGAGAVIINGTQNLTGLSGAGNLTLGDNTSLAITGADSSRYTGNLTLGANSAITPNENWTFSGVLTIAAADYNANDSWARNATSLTLTGAGNVEYTFEQGTLIPITHTDSTLTVRKTTDGTGIIDASHATDIANLIIDAGRVNLTADNTTYSFQNITIGQNATLSLNNYNTTLGGTPAILMKGGSTFELLNSQSGTMNTPVNAHITLDAAGATATIAGSLYGEGTNIGGTITGTGELLLTHSSVGTNGYTVSSTISDKSADQKLSVRVNKTGNLTMSGNNTYSGGTTIAGGTLQTNSATALGQGAVNITGGTLNANNQALANAITLQQGVVQNFGSASAPGNITVSLTGNATVNNSTVTLNNAAGAPMISTGQVLTLSGSTSATLNNAILDLSSFDTALINMQGTSSLSLTGGLTLNLGNDLVFDAASQTINLITLSSGTSLTDPGDWNSLLTVTQNGQQLIWDGVTYDNGNLTFTGLAVPEPGTATLSLLGLAALLVRRRRTS